MSVEAYALMGLTAVVAVLVAVVIYALLRFSAAARDARSLAQPERLDMSIMSGAVQEAVARLRDQEREMHARAEASERLSDEIVGSMTSGLLLVDRSGRIRVINPAGQMLLGLPADPAGDYRERLAGMPALRDVVAEGLHAGQPVIRRTLRLGPGPVSHLGVTVSPVRDPRGDLQSIICLFTDLTAVVALEEQVRLQDSLAKLGELTAGIAHEFRNGLATIHGYARLMDPAQLPSPQSTYLHGIRAETEALGKVVSNFLSFARPAALSIAPLELRAIAQRVADDMRAEVEQRGGTIDVAGDFPRIEGDELLIKQALHNLARNAVEACASSGQPPAISIEGGSGPDGSCRVAVVDNGRGIDAAILDRIFQPFVTNKSQGTGLGLALVQKIVVTHHGRVTAANRPDGGAVFEITLPAVFPGRSS